MNDRHQLQNHRKIPKNNNENDKQNKTTNVFVLIKICHLTIRLPSLKGTNSHKHSHTHIKHK